MKHSSTLIMSLFILITISSKANDTLSYTLEQSISYALESHNTVKGAYLEYEASRAKVKETRAIGLPQINGQVDLTRNFDVQQQFLPANVFDPTAPEGLIVPVGFGVNYGSIASATLSQLIFDGSYIIGLKAAKTYTQLYEQGISKSRQDIVENVTKAYLGVLVTEERLQVLKSNAELINKLYNDTEIMYNNGYIEALELQRLKVSKNNLEVEINKATTGYLLSLQLLKFQMGVSQTTPIKLSDKLKSFENKLSPVAKNATPMFKNRIDYNLLETQRDLQILDHQNNKMAYLPKLSAFLNLGYNNGAQRFSPLTEFGNWQPFSMLGFSMKVPIFSSFSRKYMMDQSSIKVQKYDLDLQLMEQNIELQVFQSKTNLENSIKTLDNQKENVLLAEEVYRISRLKYTEGVGSNYEVLDAENAYKQAQTNYLATLYDALIADVDYKIATGEIVKQ